MVLMSSGVLCRSIARLIGNIELKNWAFNTSTQLSDPVVAASAGNSWGRESSLVSAKVDDQLFLQRRQFRMGERGNSGKRRDSTDYTDSSG